jgi:hypothetical protein
MLNRSTGRAESATLDWYRAVEIAGQGGSNTRSPNIRLAMRVGTAVAVVDDAYEPARKPKSSDGISLVRHASRAAAGDPGEPACHDYECHSFFTCERFPTAIVFNSHTRRRRGLS